MLLFNFTHFQVSTYKKWTKEYLLFHIPWTDKRAHILYKSQDWNIDHLKHFCRFLSISQSKFLWCCDNETSGNVDCLSYREMNVSGSWRYKKGKKFELKIVLVRWLLLFLTQLNFNFQNHYHHNLCAEGFPWSKDTSKNHKTKVDSVHEMCRKVLKKEQNSDVVL